MTGFAIALFELFYRGELARQEFSNAVMAFFVAFKMHVTEFFTRARLVSATFFLHGDLRHRIGITEQRKVERDYSLQVWGPRVAQILRDVANQG